jgi:NAD(P)-dependent dehydrogenase (short-subunit alcohol dehydrogenase family)
MIFIDRGFPPAASGIYQLARRIFPICSVGSARWATVWEMGRTSSVTTRAATFAEFDGARVLITGGASGIGAALVAGFAAQGAKVAFLDRDATAAEATIAAVPGNTGRKPVFHAADLGKVEDAQKATDAAIADLGGLDVLVNNVGWDDRRATEDVTSDYWDLSMSVNLKAGFFTSRACMAALKTSGRGAVVNFSSIAFMMNLPDMPVYLTAKAGIVGMTKALAGEFGRHGVRVNAILPGMVLTERQKELWISDNAAADHRARQCLDFSLAPEDMVGPCLFLASQSARAISAQTLIVDGGYF